MRGDVSRRSGRARSNVVLAGFFDNHGGLSTTHGCSFYRIKVTLPEELAQKEEEKVELIVASKKGGVAGPFFKLFEDPNKLQLAAESELNQTVDNVVLDRFVHFLSRRISYFYESRIDPKLLSRLEAELAGPYPLQPRGSTTGRTSIEKNSMVYVETCERVSEHTFWVSRRVWDLMHPEDDTQDDEEEDQALLSRFGKELSSKVRPVVSSVTHAVRPAVSSVTHAVRPAVSSVTHAVRPAVSSMTRAVRPVVSSVTHAVRPVVSLVTDAVRHPALDPVTKRLSDAKAFLQQVAGTRSSSRNRPGPSTAV